MNHPAHFDLGGKPVTIAALERMIRALNDHGEVYVTGAVIGGTSLMMLGAVLAAKASNSPRVFDMLREEPERQ